MMQGKAKKPVVATATVQENKKLDKPIADDRVAAAATSEIVEEDEEEEDGKKNVRRRVRRE